MPEIRTVIVGTKHRGADAIAAVAKLSRGDTVTLRREPANAFDPNAVACYAGDVHLGYVPKNSYGPVVEALDANLLVNAEIADAALMATPSEIAPGGLPRILVRWE